ncbi:MAG: hypothetical protein H0T65_11545, partial [Deltaproteobacteria bacterium]|nr:hypothetical protein [Deltaproteobacteria bacterium]
MRHAILLLLAACGSAPSSTPKPEPLKLEPYSPPQFTSRDVFLAAKGDIVVMASRLSRDGGTTWEASPLAQVERVAIHGSTIAAFKSGLVRYDVTTKGLSQVNGAPAYASARTWRITPAGKFIVFDPLKNAIAFENAGGWTTATLPQPTPTEFDPFITDVESNGQTVLVVSAWGLHRSTDGGATFERVMPQAATMGRELVALSSAKFVLLGGTRTMTFDASGAMIADNAGVTVDTGDALACDDGALVAKGKVSRDAGATWQPLLGGGALTLTVERVGCGSGRYWVLGHSTAWGYRLLRYDSATAPGLVIGNWELSGAIAWSSSGPPIVRTGDGTFVAAGLAWRDGDASWSLREVPAKAWAAGETMFGIADGKFYQSDDAGRTWRASAATGLDGEVEAFARAPDGTFHVSRFTGDSTAAGDEWHAQVYRSTDGATWTSAYDGRATRVPGEDIVGEAHRFVGITATGAWIATDAISNDAG